MIQHTLEKRIRNTKNQLPEMKTRKKKQNWKIKVFILYRLDKYLSFPLQIHLSSFQANENCFLNKDVLLDFFPVFLLSQLVNGRVPPPIYHLNIQPSLESVGQIFSSLYTHIWSFTRMTLTDISKSSRISFGFDLAFVFFP
jgi:hypothetical protein